MSQLKRIQAAAGERFKAVHVPEWAETVHLKKLDVTGYLELNHRAATAAAGEEQFNFLARAVELSLVDIEVDPVNPPLLLSAETLYLLRDNPHVTMRLGNAVLAHNGIGISAEDQEKNSAGSPSESSPSA